MDPESRPPTPNRLHNHWWVTALVVVAIFQGIYVARHVAPYAGGADSSGYLASAKLMMQGELSTPMRLPAGTEPYAYGQMVFKPLGFVEASQAGTLVPSYPPGLPIHIAFLGKAIGIAPAICVLNVFFIIGGGWLTFALARLAKLPVPWACAGAIVLWLNPLSLFVSVQPMSDLPSFFWCTLALYTALLSERSLRWAALAGFSVGMAVLLRPSSVLLAMPVAVAFGFNWKKILVLVVGGLPAGLFQLWYNEQTLGGMFASGYGDVSLSFARENFLPSLKNVAWWLPGILSPFVIAGLFLAPTARSLHSRVGAVLLIWAVTLIIFYLFYYHTRETWWYLRFIFPCFAAVVVIALAGLHEYLAIRPGQAARWAPILAVALLIGSMAWTFRMEQKLGVNEIHIGEARYKEMTEVVVATVPRDSVIFCMQVSGALFYYTDATVIRWDNLYGEMPGLLFSQLEKHSTKIYAVLYDFETREAFERLGGHWTEIRRAGNATIWRRDS